MICKWVGQNQINGPVYAEERFLQYIMEHQKKNVMLRCGVPVITMGTVSYTHLDVYKRQADGCHPAHCGILPGWKKTHHQRVQADTGFTCTI